MPPDPPRGNRLRRAFIRTPLRQILDPPQDVTLRLVDGFIQTDVYSKPTDSHLYLPPSSATQSMFSKRSRLESPRDCVETVLKILFLTKGWRSTRATLLTRDIQQN